MRRNFQGCNGYQGGQKNTHNLPAPPTYTHPKNTGYVCFPKQNSALITRGLTEHRNALPANLKSISQANICGISLHANVTMPGALLPKHLSLKGRSEVRYVGGAKKGHQKGKTGTGNISPTLTTEKSNNVPFQEKGSNSNGQTVSTGDFVQIRGKLFLGTHLCMLLLNKEGQFVNILAV